MVRSILFLLFLFTVKESIAQVTSNDQMKLLEFYQNQKYAEAADYLISSYPQTTDAKVLTQIGAFKLLANQLPDAEKYYLQVYAQDSTSLPVLQNLARVSSRRGNNALSRKYLEKILALDTTNFNVYKQLAGLLTGSANETLKISYLEKANQLSPADPDVANDLGEIYYDAKAYDKSYKVLNTALAADTFNIELLKTKLPVCFALNKQEELIVTGERLITYGVKTAFILTQIGKACLSLKQYEKALKMFLAIEPDEVNEGSLYYTSLCYRALKNYPEAIKYANMTIKEGISPNMAGYYTLLGALQETNAQPKTAALSYKKGLQFDAHDDIYYNLGLLYDLKLSSKREALGYYRKYLSGNIDKEKNKAELEYVKGRIAILSVK